MKNKGFTLVELIVVIAILGIIMLIGVPAFAGIQERMTVRADTLSATQIGKALRIRVSDMERQSPLPEYPTIVRYDLIEDVENYTSTEYRPQSMKGGYYCVTTLPTATKRKILIGIGKNSLSITNKVYTGKDEAGWVYVEDYEIAKFLKENASELNSTVTMPYDYDSTEGGSGGG